VIYRFWIVSGRAAQRDVACFENVDEAFAKKGPSDRVFVEFIPTGFRVQVLRPGGERDHKIDSQSPHP
jgi:hypothetical protein